MKDFVPYIPFFKFKKVFLSAYMIVINYQRRPIEQMKMSKQELVHFDNDFSREVWKTTYKYYEDETPSDTLRRVAKAVASVEKTEELRKEWEEKFLDMMTDFKVIPGGRILTNAGTEWKGATLLNCFVGPKPTNPMDSIEGIYEVLVDAALTLKSEGGWGYNFSFIRPRGSWISKIGVESPGAVKFMELFDKSSEIITSGPGEIKERHSKAKGKIRKGAQMAILDVWHPDIIEFITAKQTPGRLTKFNISVNCTNEFMEKILEVERMKNEGYSEEEIEKVDKWDLIFPDTSFERYDQEWDGDIKKWKEKGYPIKVYKTVKASWLWELITYSTYNRNEPGVLFIDRANEIFPSNYCYKLVSTNPCGEQVLPYAGSCNLASLNVTQFVDEETRTLDFDKIRKYAKYMVRFLDNINDLTPLPLSEYEEFVRKKRRIGCGINGWGSALYMMKIRFGSEKARKIRDQLMHEFAKACFEASIDLAVEKGHFEGCIPERHAESQFIKNLGLSKEYMEKLKRYGIRNSSVLSCQPTGNTGVLANLISGGIEPVFMPEYVRTAIVPESEIPEDLKPHLPAYWQGQFHETDVFKLAQEGDEQILKGTWKGTVYKIDKNRGLVKEVVCEDYGVKWLKKRGEWNPNAEWAVSIEQLTVEEHINDLEGFSRYVDSNISKTINVPHDYPYEDFVKVYLEAYKTGYIKGLTTYRSGTMTAVLSKKENEHKEYQSEEIILDNVKLPNSSPALLKIFRAEGKKWYTTVVMNDDQTRPIAFFVHTNHTEKNVLTFDVIDRLFDLACRKGIPEKFIEETKKKIKNDNNSTKIARVISLLLRHGVLPKSIVFELNKIDAPVTTFVYQIRKYLTNFIKGGERIEEECSHCRSKSLVYQEGCVVCMSCGNSMC